ncbi:MAG TPA: hypothetical protein VLE53_16355 [Gemmatimonadaceae bacterium]|nr:hypothetical protein [Gemmatimonadaceae bacterium]
MTASRLRGIWQRVIDLDCVHVYHWPRGRAAPSAGGAPGAGVSYRSWTLAEAERERTLAVSDYLRHAVGDWPREWPAAARAQARLHGLVENAAVVAWGFTVTGMTEWPIAETATLLRCDPSDHLLLGFFTEPAQRGRGLYGALLRRITEDMPGTGRAMIWVQRRNRPSEHAIVRAGFSRVATHWGLKAGGVPVWRRYTIGAA